MKSFFQQFTRYILVIVALLSGTGVCTLYAHFTGLEMQPIQTFVFGIIYVFIGYWVCWNLNFWRIKQIYVDQYALEPTVESSSPPPDNDDQAMENDCQFYKDLDQFHKNENETISGTRTMSEQSVKERIVNLISENLGIPKDEILMKSCFAELGQDSLDMIELVMSIEEEFDIRIPDTAFRFLQTTEQVIMYVEELKDNAEEEVNS